MTVKFMSLASGSSGNCYYLATDNTAILVDAGIGIRTIKKVFKERMLNLEGIQAVLVTHDHADHIKAVGHLGEKHGIPVYTTPEIHEGMKHSYCMTERLSPERTRFIRKEETFSVGDFTITCFEVPHDGTDNVGYCITAGNKTFSFLTDIGHITPTASRFIQQADYLILEANYDDSMLQMGPYPQHLEGAHCRPERTHEQSRNGRLPESSFSPAFETFMALPPEQGQQPSGVGFQDSGTSIPAGKHHRRKRRGSNSTEANHSF